MQNKSRIVRLSIVGGIVAVGITSSMLTNFGSADTTNQPIATPAVIESVAPATTEPTPSQTPVATPTPSPTLTTLQSQVDDHEGRITVLEQQATNAPVATAAIATPSPTPSATPKPNLPPCTPTGHGNNISVCN